DALQGVDVKDKIAVVGGSGLPKGVTFNDLTGKQGEDWDTPHGYLAKRGAKGIVIVPNSMILGNWARQRQSLIERAPVSVEKFKKSDAPDIPLIYLSEKTVDALFLGEKVEGPAMLQSASS